MAELGMKDEFAPIQIGRALSYAFIYLLVTVLICRYSGLKMLSDVPLTILFSFLTVILPVPFLLAGFKIVDLVCNFFNSAKPPLWPDFNIESEPKKHAGRWFKACYNLTRHALRLFLFAVPILIVFYCYSHLKALIPILRLTESWDQAFWDLDNKIIPGITPFPRFSWLVYPPVEKLFQVSYHSLSFFYSVVLTGLYFNRNFRLLRATVTALIISYFSANILYFVFPCDGPVFFRPEFFSIDPGSPIGLSQKWLLYRRELFCNDISTYQVQYFNGIAGFPSMHIAQTLILLWAIKKGLPRIFSLSAIYELLLLISTLFFGWHYLVDDLAGILVAYVAIKASIKLENEKSEPIMSLVKELREKAEDGEDCLTKELETAKARITKQNHDL